MQFCTLSTIVNSLVLKVLKIYHIDYLLLSCYEIINFVNTSEWVNFKKVENRDAQLHN